ncbi:MAG: NAD-dependent epimerase/dehydratase family protein, partial [Phycisphaeraceae bacterium]
VEVARNQHAAVVQRLVRDPDLNAVTLRPTAIYGPGDPARFLMLYRMCRRGTFHMFGDGQTTYHPVYIDNLVDGFLAAAGASDHKGRTYIVADERYYTLNELVQHVGASMGTPVRIRHWPFWPLYGTATCCETLCRPVRVTPPLFRRRVDWFRQVRAFRIDRAREELGYQPRVGIERGLEQTARWYRDHGYI